MDQLRIEETILVSFEERPDPVSILERGQNYRPRQVAKLQAALVIKVRVCTALLEIAAYSRDSRYVCTFM